MQSTKTVEELRAFLRLCLDPGPGRSTRTVGQLAEQMPDWLAVEIAAHNPQVAEFRVAAMRAQAAYKEGLRAWIQEQIGDEHEVAR